jgi:hypothetical protein
MQAALLWQASAQLPGQQPQLPVLAATPGTAVGARSRVAEAAPPGGRSCLPSSSSHSSSRWLRRRAVSLRRALPSSSSHSHSSSRWLWRRAVSLRWALPSPKPPLCSANNPCQCGAGHPCSPISLSLPATNSNRKCRCQPRSRQGRSYCHCFGACHFLALFFFRECAGLCEALLWLHCINALLWLHCTTLKRVHHMHIWFQLRLHNEGYRVQVYVTPIRITEGFLQYQLSFTHKLLCMALSPRACQHQTFYCRHDLSAS